MKISRELEFLLKLGKPQALALSGALMLVIMACDYLTDYEISLAHLYILPVLILAWNADFKWAFAGACVASVLAISVDASVGYPYSGIGYLIFEIGSVFMVLVISAAIASNLRKNHDMLARASVTDHLTGIANRAGFEQRAGLELLQHKRYPAPLSLVLIDCDNFKQVNDKKGHAEGDRLLVAAAARLQSSIRGTDFAARLGGDEFVVLLPRTGLDEARLVARKLREDLDRAMVTGAWPVTVSMGVATFASSIPNDISEALKLADQLMYQAKHEGKDTTRSAQV
jgi:diguanylate cyclase (GGDEF)-like protein